MAVPGRSRAGSSTFGDHLHSLTHPPPEEKPVLILYIYQVPGKRDLFLTTHKVPNDTVTNIDVTRCTRYLRYDEALHPEAKEQSSPFEILRKEPSHALPVPSNSSPVGSMNSQQGPPKIHRKAIGASSSFSASKSSLPLDSSSDDFFPALPPRPFAEPNRTSTELSPSIQANSGSESTRTASRVSSGIYSDPRSSGESSVRDKPVINNPEDDIQRAFDTLKAQGLSLQGLGLDDTPIDARETEARNDTQLPLVKQGLDSVGIDSITTMTLVNVNFSQQIFEEVATMLDPKTITPLSSTNSSTFSHPFPMAQQNLRGPMFIDMLSPTYFQYGTDVGYSTTSDSKVFTRRLFKRLPEDTGFKMVSPVQGEIQFEPSKILNTISAHRHIYPQRGTPLEQPAERALVSKLKFNFLTRRIPLPKKTGRLRRGTLIDTTKDLILNGGRKRSTSALSDGNTIPPTTSLEAEDEERLDLSLAQERNRGGLGGDRPKLGKLIVYEDGAGFLDLLLAANMLLFNRAWERVRDTP